MRNEIIKLKTKNYIKTTVTDGSTN